MIEYISDLTQALQGYIQSMVGFLSGMEPILIPVITTVVAIVSGRYIWQWRSKPVLVFRGCSSTYGVGDSYNQDEWDGPVTDFRIQVENWGLTAAENCKPEISLKGQSETHRYEISTSVFWSEGNNPSRQTINRGENIGLAFIRWGSSGTEHFVRFPSENGWLDYSTLSEEPLPKFKEKVDGVAESVTMNRTNVDVLTEVEWDIALIRVTAENTDVIEGEIEILWENRKPVINVYQTHGSVLHYWRGITHRIKKAIPHISFYQIIS